MLEAHPREKSIIVNYKLEAAVYGDGDVVDPMLADKKVSQAATTTTSKAAILFWIVQCHNNGHNLFNTQSNMSRLFGL